MNAYESCEAVRGKWVAGCVSWTSSRLVILWHLLLWLCSPAKAFFNPQQLTFASVEPNKRKFLSLSQNFSVLSWYDKVPFNSRYWIQLPPRGDFLPRTLMRESCRAMIKFFPDLSLPNQKRPLHSWKLNEDPWRITLISKNTIHSDTTKPVASPRLPHFS